MQPQDAIPHRAVQGFAAGAAFRVGYVGMGMVHKSSKEFCCLFYTREKPEWASSSDSTATTFPSARRSGPAHFTGQA